MRSRPVPARLLCLLLCLGCLCAASPARAAAAPESHTASDSPVYRSKFTLSLAVDADAFPAPVTEKRDYRAWQALLSKLSLQGTIDTQDFLSPLSRVYFDGGLYLNGRNALPFTYDGYYNFRYVRSPALDGASVHFQMNNFFEFMFKPYDYYGLPTQYLALLMYPEAAVELGTAYWEPIRAALGGEGARAYPYEALEELAAALDAIALEDEASSYRLDNFLRCLLYDLGQNDAAYEALCDLESWLAFLDPDEGGLSVNADADGERWTIGGREVFVRSDKDGFASFSLRLPNADGQELWLDWTETDAEAGWNLDVYLAVAQGEETRASARLALHGLPKADDKTAQGTAEIAFGGSALAPAAQRFAFRFERSKLKPPCRVTLEADWLHPQTGRAAVTLSYAARMGVHNKYALVDRAIDNQDDFFHLNESYIEEYKQRFLPTLALAAVPFLLETPGAVLNELVGFLNDTGILMTLGLE